MKNQKQIITLRNTIEKIIPVFVHDPLLIDRTQVDYFNFYNKTLEGLANMDVDTAIRSMDKFGYNDILVRNLVEYISYFERAYRSKEQQISLLSQNTGQIQQDYLDFHHPLLDKADTYELVQLNNHNSEKRKEIADAQTFIGPYLEIKKLINHTSQAIEKYIKDISDREYISIESTKDLIDILVKNNAFTHNYVDVYEFFNLLNLKPYVMEYNFVSETPKFLLINQIGSKLNKELRKIWINGIIKLMDVNTESFGKNKRRVPEIWKVLNDDLESFRLT